MALSRQAREWLLLAATAAFIMGVLAWTSRQRGDIQWNYLAGLLIVIVIYAIFALGLSLEFGFTGLLNFGHVGFMLIGAYTYGILMMRPPDRPANAARLVGALYDASPAFEGASVGGALVCLLAAALAGAIVAVPVLLAVRRFPAGRGRAGLVTGFATGGAVALLVFLLLFPLSAPGALNAAALVAMLLGVILAAIAGLLLGLPTVRLREDYLAIVTIGAAEILRSVALNEEAWTRGTRNVVNFPRPLVDWAIATPWWREFARGAEVLPASLAILLASVLVLAVVFLVLETLARSPWGRVLQAIREDEEAAASLGKNVLWYKLQSLMVGSGVAAIAGILLVTYLANISPTHFLPLVTFYAFIIVVVGGMGKHKGAIAGAFILWGVFSFAQNVPTLRRILLPPRTVETLPGVVADFLGPILILLAIALGAAGFALVRRAERHRGEEGRGALVGGLSTAAAFVAAVFVLLVGLDFAGVAIAAGPPQGIFIGVVLILIMMFRPQGLLGQKEELLFAK